MAWACGRCDTTHTQNPAECRNCGHKIFSPVSDSELKQRGTSTGSNRRADIESDQLIGTVTDPNYRSSPDVTVSGDIAEETTEQSVVDDPTPTPGRFNSVYYWVRATLLAPLGLLRQYVVPILAFFNRFRRESPTSRSTAYSPHLAKRETGDPRYRCDIKDPTPRSNPQNALICSKISSR
jgi:DNA-directed RNA polymerase subunit RPC12/RpoP